MSGLFQDSGHATADARRSEADRLTRILDDYVDQMTESEKDFVYQMSTEDEVSTKQIFWLRDIKDRLIG